MHYMTEKNLSDSFAGESQAYVKYSLFADKAEKEGKPNVARLFRAVAHAELVHATSHLRVLSRAAATTENLESAISGENFEITEMYPLYIEVARVQGERSAERTMNFANEVEKVHRQLFSQTLQTVKEGRDIESQEVYVCGGCGYTSENSAPDTCPVCGAPKTMFKKF